FVGGAWQHTSGVYVDVNSEGPCVEVLTTTLVVHPNEEVELEINICEGESWFAGGAWQTTSGTYVDQYQTLFGCDSIVTTLLTVTSNSSAPFVIDLGDGLVQASQVASGYQWTVDGLGCDILTFTAGQVLDLTAYCTSEAYVVSLQTSTSGCISPSSDEVTVILADCTQLNDYCSGAVNLVVDGPALFDSNQCATNFGENPGYCTDDIGRSVWYKFTATSGLDVDISIDNITPITADFNPKLEVFSGGCLSMTQLACVNVAGNSGTEVVSLDDLAAGTYLVRVSGFLIQKGAYSISVEKSGSCLGDFDFNGVVNVSDVLIFSSQFGCTSGCTVDLDGNGAINVTDLLILSSVFGNVCP
ncbi:MAG: pre-peptidase C-terminal domain-containing protein, partial [Flavobacteriales bacterium]|nr:pre-peptidase C-terminal domain-containing protein [Flavobacteriales bacterium]